MPKLCNYLYTIRDEYMCYNWYNINQWQYVWVFEKDIELSIVGTVPSSVNPLTDTVPHQVIPQYENVDMITNILPTTELEMNTRATYGVIKQWSVKLCNT